MREITDGCFCCRFESLIEAAESLTLEVRPDVFLAEPVGSCTDLRATVQLPLARLYGDAYRVAPLSVLVDPLRAARAFGVDPGPSFSSRVLYIYDKQIEEADFLVLNKIDIIRRRAARRSRGGAGAALSERRDRAASALAPGQGWRPGSIACSRLRQATRARPWTVDYDLYADGESLLGWVNATSCVRAERDFDGNHFLRRLADALRDRLASAAVEIAHLKMTLATGADGDRATINLVRSDGSAELARRLSGPIRAAELTVNLRAEDDPERLHALLLDDVAAIGARGRRRVHCCARKRTSGPDGRCRLIGWRRRDSRRAARFSLSCSRAAMQPAARGGATAEAEPPPNFVLFLADDLGYGDVEINGASVNRTPNLARLAAEGIRLTSFYAAGNWCMPTRASILTASYPQTRRSRPGKRRAVARRALGARPRRGRDHAARAPALGGLRHRAGRQVASRRSAGRCCRRGTASTASSVCSTPTTAGAKASCAGARCAATPATFRWR